MAPCYVLSRVSPVPPVVGVDLLTVEPKTDNKGARDRHVDEALSNLFNPIESQCTQMFLR